MRIEELQPVTNGCLLLERPDEVFFEQIELDTRQLAHGRSCLFVALIGPFHNAHEHLSEAIERGVTNFMVSEPPPEHLVEKANWLFVPDTRKAFQDMAAAHRAQFRYPVIGITGSNGKTWVKEWLYQLLSSRFTAVKSPKSYNSQVGVPISVMAMNEGHDLGIFEAGISLPGEMEQLARIIRPDIGIFTRLGDAHAVHFKDSDHLLREKWKLFEGAGTIVCCLDQPELDTFTRNLSSPFLMTWSALGNPAALVQVQYVRTAEGTQINYRHKDKTGEVMIPFDDEVSRWNATVCLATLLALEIEPTGLSREFAALEPIAMRMELVEGRDGSLLINDSYNSDMEGLRKALSFMQLHGKDREKWAVISDLPESGKEDRDRFREMAEMLRHFELVRVIGVGEAIQGIQECLAPDIAFEPVHEVLELEHLLEQRSLHGRIILFKGARKYRLDLVCSALEQATHLTELEIRLDALRHNLEYFRGQLAPKTSLIAVVKAAAYGIGSQEIARFLEQVNIDRLAVAYTDEGIELRRLGVNAPIMVLNPDPSTFDLMIHHRLEPEIYSLKRLDEWLHACADSPYPAAMHLKLETGMHRLGIEAEQIETLCRMLKQQDLVRVASIMTHLSASEDPAQDVFSHQQVSRFQEMYEPIAQNLGYRPDRHVLNSNGIVRFPEYHFEGVRLGIGLYGVGIPDTLPCQPVHRLVSRIAQIKSIGAGDSVGYGRSFVAEKPMKIATINLGYADGLPRSAGNGRFRLFLKGRLCMILGNVCMDMTMIDVTDVPEVAEGDEVVIFGPEHPMQHLSDAAGTIPYEILTGIGPRVKRRFIEE